MSEKTESPKIALIKPRLTVERMRSWLKKRMTSTWSRSQAEIRKAGKEARETHLREQALKKPQDNSQPNAPDTLQKNSKEFWETTRPLVELALRNAGVHPSKSPKGM